MFSRLTFTVAAVATAMLLTQVPTAFAERPLPPPKPKPTPIAVTASANAAALSAQQQKQAQQQQQAQQQVQKQVAQGGAGGAGGSVMFEEGAFDSGDVDVQVRTDNPVQAPSVYAPPAGTTAPFMKCFSLGGSMSSGNRAGGASGVWCWIARDVYAADQYHMLAGMCAAEAASKAYCTRFNSKPFGGKQQCRETMQASVENYCVNKDKEPPMEVHVKVDKPCCAKIPPSRCPEKLRRCEREINGGKNPRPQFKPNCDGTYEDCVIKD